MNAKIQSASNSGRVREIFCELRRIEQADERERVLAERTGDDKELRCQVEQLLSAAQLAASSPLERVGNIIGPTELLEPSSSPQSGMPEIEIHSMIGPYKLMEQIGEGGMGVVYVALQQHPIRRMVALKLVKPGMSSKQVLARFDAERQALAMMNHPNIAKVLDAGTTDIGTPYFAMELVKGILITEYCEKHKLNLRERLELFVKVCDAIQHAHQKGIIHRDLKPSNILVELEDVRAVPKVIDFGVAKAMQQPLTEQTIYTGIAQMIGTPLYMSPEQAELNGLDVDTRSDVYSLGVVLYELITGLTPFDRDTLKHASFDEMRRIIREEEPIRPSSRISTFENRKQSTLMARDKDTRKRVNASIQSELDWIVMRALEKDRARRYPTPNALAEDISRFLKGETVEACPPSLGYRMSKLARKHRAALAIASLIFFGLLTTAVGTGWQAMRATKAEKSLSTQLRALQEEEQKTLIALQIAKDSEAEQKRLRGEADAAAERERAAADQQRTLTAQANWSRYQADMRFAQSKISQQEFSDAIGILSRHLVIDAPTTGRGWELSFLLGQTIRNTQGWKIGTTELSGVDWSPDGNEIATVGYDGTCRILAAKTGDVIRSWHLGRTILCSVAWSPNGNFLAWGSAGSENTVRIWSRETDQIQEIQVLPSDKVGSVWSLGWNKDSASFTAGCIQMGSSDLPYQNLVRFERNEQNQWVRSCSDSTDATITLVGYSADNSMLAVISGTVEFRDGIDLRISHKALDNLTDGDWLVDKRQIVCGTSNGDCILYDPIKKQEISRFQAHHDRINDIQTSPDASFIATCGDDGWIKIWDPTDNKLVVGYQQHQGAVKSVAWNPDATQLASVGADGYAFVHTIGSANDRQLWTWDRTSPESGWTKAEFHWTKNNNLRIVQGGKAIADANPRSGVLLHTLNIESSEWTRLISDELAIVTQGNEEYVVFIEDPNLRYRIGNTLQASNLVTSTGNSLVTFPSHLAKPVVIDKNGDSKEIVSPSKFRSISEMRCSHSGLRLALVGAGLETDDGNPMWAGWLHVVELSGDGSYRRARIGDQRADLRAVAWSPDDKWIVTTNRQGLCALTDSDTLRTKWSRFLHRGVVESIAWHPSGERVATAGADRKVNVWEPQSGDILLSLDMNDEVYQLEFSPDGTMLAAALGNGQIAVWDALPGQQFADSKLTVDLIITHTLDEIVRQENWSRLRDVLQQSVERSESPSLTQRYDLALINAYLSNPTAYSEACGALLSKLDDATSTEDRFFASWACALLPTALSDYTDALRAAQTAIDRNRVPEISELMQRSLGAMYLRSGNLQKAIEVLQPIVDQDSQQSTSTPYVHFLLALTYHAMNDSTQARRYCEEANRRMESEMLSGDTSWNRRLTYKIFQREANQAIFGE